jgi:ribonuclease P protein component
LTRAPEIARVRARGVRIRGDFVELRLVRSRDPGSRVGVIVPKHKQIIVKRNLVKRRLRELVRSSHAELPLQGEMLVIAGPRAYAAGFDALRQDLSAVWRRAAGR